MPDYYEKALQAAKYISSRIGTKPQTGIILGSGLGSLVGAIDEPVEIDFREIPGFPEVTVEGHAGKLVSGLLAGRRVLVMKGRFHYYEGYDISQVVLHIRVFKLLGIGSIIVTNAAGGINKSLQPGNLMIIKDHIGLFAPSPLRGINLSEFGSRFPDMSSVYDTGLRKLTKEVAVREGIDIKEGVYAYAQGPMYETPAEIRAMAILGADAVGMSTVPEVIAARHSGMKVLGISCITNMAAGVADKPLKHEEVMEIAGKVERNFTSLIKGVAANWDVFDYTGVEHNGK